MSRKLTLLLLSIFMCSCDNKLKSKDNLIPREVLFGNPEKVSPKISPDSKKIAYIAPVNNILNVWVGNLDQDLNLVNAKPITSDTNRGIRNFSWSPDSTQILYTQDTNGDENWRLYGVDLQTKTTKNYTPFDKVTVGVVNIDKRHQDSILLAINKEDIRFHDVYRLDLNSGDLKMIFKNPGYTESFIINDNQEVVAAVKTLNDGSSQLIIKKDNCWESVINWNQDDTPVSGPVAITDEQDTLYIEDSRDYNTARLIKFNYKTLKSEVILQDPNYDISSVTIDGDTHKILWANIIKDKQNLIFFNEKYKQIFEDLKKIDFGEVNVLVFDDKKEKIVVCFEKDNGPVNYYIYDIPTKKYKFLFENRPALKNYKLAHMEPISFKSRDGIEIHGYLTLPLDRSGKVPLVLDVHGGPTVRDYWGYNGQSQWFANRGYAVLQVNYRGSRGYGKNFINIGDREWGGKMHDDLIDAVNWAIESGITEKNKIAIYGGSYGGYAALVGATFTPDVFCCAVDIVGPSNLITLLNSIPEYWESGRAELYKRVGHPEKDKEFLESRSPLFKAGNIKIPLLIAQGKHDPRVKEAEAQQIVDALKAKNIPHEYMLFEDEGHGFAKPQNRLKFYAAAEKFLAQNLGGRYQE